MSTGKKTGRFGRGVRFLMRQWRVDRFRFIACIALAVMVVYAGVMAVGGQLVEQAQYQSLLARTHSENLNAFQKQLADGDVRGIITHTVNTGTLISPHYSEYKEVELKNGKNALLPASLLSNTPTQTAIINQALKQDIEFRQGLQAGDSGNKLMEFIFFVLYIASFVLIFLLVQRAGTDLLVGKSFKPKSVNVDIGFDDIIGYDEVKREFRETLLHLKKAKKFAAQGIVAPKGILLTGSPGVGKTMFAKALANESGAAFLYATGSDFAELYVGTGARRARSLFATARQSSPTVIFIDEIDALGARDSMGMDTERLATINQLLAEMDGFSENQQVLVIGATNYPEKLDPAMKRPGRFDKIINIPLPNAFARQGILKQSLGETELGEDVDLGALALRAQGFSGAQLKNWAAEAKNLALREGDGESVRVSRSTMERAQEILIMGYSQTIPTKKEEKLVAYHELGHALVAKRLRPDVIVDKVAAAGRGAALGFTFNRPVEEQNLLSESQMMGEIASLLAGRAAEEIFMHEVSTGSSNDLERANAIASKMVCELGFGARNPLLTHKSGPGLPVPESMRADIQDILSKQYVLAKSTIEAHRGWMERAQKRLLDKGMLSDEELFGDLDWASDVPDVEQVTPLVDIEPALSVVVAA